MALSYKDRLRKLLDGDDKVLKSLNDEIEDYRKNLETYGEKVEAPNREELAKRRSILDEKIRGSKNILNGNYTPLTTTTEIKSKYEQPKLRETLQKSFNPAPPVRVEAYRPSLRTQVYAPPIEVVEIVKEEAKAAPVADEEKPEIADHDDKEMVVKEVVDKVVVDDEVETKTESQDTIEKIIKEATERNARCMYTPRVYDNYFASPYRDKPSSNKNIPAYAKRYFESKDNMQSKYIISRFNYLPR